MFNLLSEAGSAIDPIHQFQIHKIFSFGFGGYDFSFTNASLVMIIVVLLAILPPLFFHKDGIEKPTRFQAIYEIIYEFVENMVVSNAGNDAMIFFPLVLALFLFIMISNLIGLIPYSFTITSQILVTASLSLIVFLTVIIAGLWNHGLAFFKLFVPSGVPIFLLVIITPIEIISFFSRPLSHSLRLFANMLAGHITLAVFGGFVVMLVGSGVWVILSPLPMIMIIGLTALEFLVAFLQAYVFAMLTCMYLHDALHPGH